MEYIKFARIQGKKYPINTDFRVALKCDEIINAPENEVSDRERGIRITGLLFGEDSPYCPEALEKAEIYLSGGVSGEEKRIIDFKQHWYLLYTVFISQYGINLNTEYLHYQEFLMLLQGLKGQVLNDVVELLTYDLREAKDPKERKRIKEAQEKFKIKDTAEEMALKERQEQFLNLLSKKVKGG